MCIGNPPFVGIEAKENCKFLYFTILSCFHITSVSVMCHIWFIPNVISRLFALVMHTLEQDRLFEALWLMSVSISIITSIWKMFF